jgi:hypothetical protein
MKNFDEPNSIGGGAEKFGEEKLWLLCSGEIKIGPRKKLVGGEGPLRTSRLSGIQSSRFKVQRSTLNSERGTANLAKDAKFREMTERKKL